LEEHTPHGLGRTIAVGDVHGCIHALDALLEAIEPAGEDTLVFLGDMVDHGRNARETLERIAELERRCRTVLIQGNHEEMMLWAREGPEALRYWENHGGAPTLNSYRFPGRLADVPDAHWDILERLVPYLETEDFIFTHANFQADLPMSEQLGQQMRWVLFDAREVRPHCSGKPVIVGHTEQRDAEILDLGYAMCIDTACWRYGWLTAIEPATGETWQASKWGLVREPGELNHQERLSVLLAKG
jgi:serine/threonine protein phosphatase 1